MKDSFLNQEYSCEFQFRQLGDVFHLSTPENHPLIFSTEADYKRAMSILALCASMSPSIKIFTFQIMSNHFHFVVCGDETIIKQFFQFYLKCLRKASVAEGVKTIPEMLDLNIRRIENVDQFRNSIAYDNRNGSVVNPDETPFSYPWGANRFFFNPDAKKRVDNSTTCLLRDRQNISHSRKFDKVEGLKMTDGYISPMSFCYIDQAESLFRNARQYFTKISRNMESWKEFANAIGESIYYTDEDMNSIVLRECQRVYSCSNATMLNPTQKIELAKKLHFEYKSGNKQISRLLKMDIQTINALFPLTSR